MKRLLWSGIFVLLLLSGRSVYAQATGSEIIINVTIPPPYTPDLSVWRSDPSRIIISLTNTTSRSYRVRLSGFAENGDGSVRIETKDDYPLTAINVGPTATVVLSGRDLSLTDGNAVRFRGTSSTTIARTGRLPEGSYRLCLKALNFDRVSEQLSAERCGNFTIAYLDPPRIITPTCDGDITTTSPQTIVFTWVMPTAPAGAINYQFTLLELTGTQSVNDAFRAGGSRFILDRTVSMNSLIYGPSDPPLRVGARYGWRVQAKDPSGRAIMRNDGYSEACAFRFGSTSSSSGTLSMNAVYPDAADTIPYLPPHLIVRFTPYNDNITRMDYTLTCTGGGSTFTSHRVLNWPEGPRRGQRWPDASYNDRSTYIIVNQDESGAEAVVSPWSNNLRQGVEYSWTVRATFTVGGSPVTVTTAPRTFFIGVTQPGLSSPRDRAEIARTAQPITLSWQSRRPHSLNPPDLLGMGARSTSMFFGATDEHFLVELSRSRTFTSTVATFPGRPASYHTGDDCVELYQVRNHELSRLDTGTYYWRVKWLRPDESVYTESPTLQFHIGDSTGSRPDTTRRAGDTTSAACRDVCSVTAPTNRTASTRTFAVGDSLSVGRFRLGLTRVTGTGSSLSGEGTIRVPYLRAPIMVEFSGISVNTDNVVYEGQVTGKQATGSPITSSVANSLASAIGLTNEQISSIQTFASQTEHLVSAFVGNTPVGLPIGFDNTIGGDHLVLGVIGLVFRPTDAKLNAVMSFEIPDMGPGVGIGVGARDICFHPGGIGGDGNATLYLATDLGYRSVTSWGFVFKAPTATDSGTYLSFDCNGFKELRLAADVEFPRTWFTPIPDDGASLVKAQFRTTITSRGDWIAAASLDNCSIAGADGFGLEVQEMTIDNSSIRNPVGIEFPSDTHRYSGPRDNTWQGFYIRRCAVRLPDVLRTFDSSRPPTIAVNNMLINSTGLTASFRVENIIQWPRGNFGEWGASLDTIFVNLVCSSLESGGISGRIKIPISDSALIYRAVLSQSPSNELRFSFTIQPRDTINANLWIAKLALLPTSRIELTNESGSFVASATLSGSFRLDGGTSMPAVSLLGVRFENFRVMTASPYIERGTWSFASPQHSILAPDPDPPLPTPTGTGTTGGFPISISGINIVTGDRGGSPGIGLQFTISLNIMGGSGGISGGTQLSVWGKLGSGSGPMNFVYDGFQLDSVGVRGEIASILTVEGYIVLYRSHPTFGDGFRGAIRANFLQQLEVTASCQFGNVGGYRYWYVDARIAIASGIPIFTGVGIYGFGGAVWGNMHQTDGAATYSANSSVTPPARDTTPGRTNSGFSFTPQNGEFGFRAMVVLGTHPSADGFNCDVSFYASFTSSGGILDIGIRGDGYMLAGIMNRPSAKVTMTVSITYNFPAERFHGAFSININASPLTGGGDLVIHAEPSTWYIHVGQMYPLPDPTIPSRGGRIGLSLAGWLNIYAYLMIGMDIPSPPEPPPAVTSILGPLPLTRNPAMARGDGFAFGAMAAIHFRGEFLIFYGQIDAGLGFDIALLNFGPNAACDDIPGTMGVNGWYALGQIYAYVSASIGLHVDLFFWSGDIEILSLAVAAALQGGAPNPAWVKGVVGGRYSVLDGAIIGSCRFEFQLGEQCRPVTDNPLGKVDLITELQPADGARDVDVFVHPTAAFQFVPDVPFDLTDINRDGEEYVRTFRVKVRSATLHRGTTNIGSPYSMLEEGTVLQYNPDNALAGEAAHTFSVTAYGQEYVRRSTWEDARRRDGGSIAQTATANWRTGPEPDYLRPQNIAYSYPLDRQRYFLQGECQPGYIFLKQGVTRPFQASTRPNIRTTWHVRFIKTQGDSGAIEVEARYNAGARNVSFPIPTLLNNTSYCIQLVRRERSTLMVARTFFAIMPRSLSLYNRMTNTVVQEQPRRLPGATTLAGDHLLFYYYFKTSQFNRLSDKIASLELYRTDSTPPLGMFQLHTAKFTGAELMDEYDQNGYRYTNNSGALQWLRPLIEPTARTRTDRWHRNFANPWVYDAITRMRRSGFWFGGAVQFERYASGLGSLRLAEYASRPKGLMRDDEMLPPAPTSRFLMSMSTGRSFTMPSGFGTIGGAPGMSTVIIGPQTLNVQYNHGIVVPFDFTAVRNSAARALSYYGGGEFLSAEDERWLRSLVSKQYERLYNGFYTLRFEYPYCQEPDSPVTGAQRRFLFGIEPPAEPEITPGEIRLIPRIR